MVYTPSDPIRLVIERTAWALSDSLDLMYLDIKRVRQAKWSAPGLPEP
jgi:hypothetical protein